jgi:hypothetical protein
VMTEPHEMSKDAPLEGSAAESVNGAGEAQTAAQRGRRIRARHALAGAAIAAVLVGGALRLVPSGQAAPNTGQGAAASTACSAS